VAALLPALVLGSIEVGLRHRGYGFSTDFFLQDQRDGTPVLTDNARFTRWVFPPAQARGVAPFSIPAPKGADTYRIFVLGESAAMGDPEPAFSFARMIEVLLRERYPATRFEVVNTGITAINSHVILPIARDCARQEGDLWLIYMGHNEVVGPFGAGTVFGAEVPPLPIVRAGLAVRSLRIGQAAESLVRWFRDPGHRESAWGGMKMFLGRQVAADDPRMERVYSSFESNLSAILQAGRRAGVQQIVCTVGSNLRDCPPFASRHGATFADPSAWDATFGRGVEAESHGRLAEALEAYERAARVDPAFAELEFRRARCLRKLGRRDEALRRFERARDLDTLRFRADGRINRVVESQARARAGRGVHLLDAARVLAVASPDGIPGQEAFYEHVHLTFEGNYLIARAAAERIASLLPGAIARRRAPAPWLSREACAERLGWNAWSESRVLRTLHARLQEAPFTNQLEHGERMARLERRMAALGRPRGRRAMEEALTQYRRAIARAPEDAVLRHGLATLLVTLGDFGAAVEEWRAMTRLLPHDAAPYEGLGMALCQMGRCAEAERQFARALEIDPGAPDALNGMGVALIRQGRFSRAVRTYERALGLGAPLTAGLRVNLAYALENLGRNAEAERRYREALRLEPQNEFAGLSLGALLLKEHRVSEAVVHLQDLVSRYPQSANAHAGLGVALVQQSSRTDAAAHLREALRLDPENVLARRQLDALAPPPRPARRAHWAREGSRQGL